MGWTGGQFEFPRTMGIKEMEAEIRSSLIENRGFMEPVSQKLKLFADKVYPDRESAEEALDKEYGKYMREFDRGVPYIERGEPKRTKKHADILDRLEAARKKKESYYAKHRVQGLSADFVGCKSCGSKLKRELVPESQKCPLCKVDLRPKTTLETLARYSADIKELEKSAKEEARKEALKNKGREMWLVEADMYLG